MGNYFDEQQSGPTIGSFEIDRSTDFKQGVVSLFEGMRNTYSVDPMTDLAKILSMDNLKEAYKDSLIGDVLQEGFQDDYYRTLPEKMEQLFENSALDIISESTMGQLSPIVGLSLPILKKNYLESHGKDVVMTEVPTKPIIKVAFERQFLKDKNGVKHYIPDIFWNNTYETIFAQIKGKAINADFHPIPTQDLEIMSLSGGSIQTRDSLAMDFIIQAVKIETTAADGVTKVETLVEGLSIAPDMANNNTLSYRIRTKGGNGDIVEDIIVGQVDFYNGRVSVSSTSGKIKSVQFGGHLSNENNVETAELDREREVREWKIPDGGRVNTGMTIERIKDAKALLNIDWTADIIASMSKVLTEFEDSSIFAYLDKQLNAWKGKTELPFGYTDGFTESFEFDMVPPTQTMVTQSQYITSEMPFRLTRQINALKNKIKSEEIMFVIYGNPENVTLIQDQVKWIIDDDTKIGGIQLEYKFGVLTGNKDRVHVVSSLKVPKSRGLRIVAFPLSKEVITFKHYKYSFNIENAYRNPLTPLTPNVMGTSRYLTTHVLPVQGEFLFKNDTFGRQP